MLCFDKACGIASILKKETSLENILVSGYLDVNEMADKAIELIRNKELYKATSELTKKRSAQWFNMESYITQIDNLGQAALKEEICLNKEIDYLERNKEALPMISTASRHIQRKEYRR